MSELDQYGIRRKLIEIEAKLVIIRRSFDGFMPDDCPEKKNLDQLLKRVVRAQKDMQRFFE